MADRYDGKSNAPREYHDVLYVYDRVCPKESKKRQIDKTYRPDKYSSPAGFENRNPNRVYGKAFAERQRRRAEEYARCAAESSARGAGYGEANFKHTSAGSARRQNGGYNDRPGRAQGGEAVREKPLKLLIDGIINLFESIEDRGRADERIAKQKAIAFKKFSEYKHALTTAFILVLITAVFCTLVYNMFFVIKDIGAEGSEIYSSDTLTEVSGIEAGTTLYSFKAADAEEEIIFRCPYIKSAEISRTLPNKVTITVEDDSAYYITKIWDHYVVLSSGLKVLDIQSEKADAALIELVLPPVSYSVGGRVIEFEDPRDERFIRSILDEVANSSLGTAGMVDKIDLSNEYAISIQSAGKYLMQIGDETNCDLKLRMAYKTVTSKDFEAGTPARINLSEVGEASVRYDLQLSFD